MSNPNATPTIRIKADTESGFAIVNAEDFNHDEHELHDKKDKHLIPPRPQKVSPEDASDIEGLKKQLAEALDRAVEAESERDEWKARAEAAEAAQEEKGKKGR